MAIAGAKPHGLKQVLGEATKTAEGTKVAGQIYEIVGKKTSVKIQEHESKIRDTFSNLNQIIGGINSYVGDDSSSYDKSTSKFLRSYGREIVSFKKELDHVDSVEMGIKYLVSNNEYIDKKIEEVDKFMIESGESNKVNFYNSYSALSNVLEKSKYIRDDIKYFESDMKKSSSKGRIIGILNLGGIIIGAGSIVWKGYSLATSGQS